jgi:hypothetical protein
MLKKQQGLGSLGKVHFKVERSYGQEFLEAKARLTLEQLGLEHLVQLLLEHGAKQGEQIFTKFGQHNTYA